MISGGHNDPPDTAQYTMAVPSAPRTRIELCILRADALPELEHRSAIRRDHHVRHRPSLDRDLATERHRTRDGHDQAVAGEPAHKRVAVIAQKRFSGKLSGAVAFG